jgi:small subunit ribosomal protein S20
MPNIKSAKKRVKVIEVKTKQNKMLKSALRTNIKKADIAIQTSAVDCADVLKMAIINIDKAVTKGILHKNTAARKKSRLTVRFNAKQA